MITLNNGVLKVLIDEMGAQIRSVVKDEKEPLIILSYIKVM